MLGVINHYSLQRSVFPIRWNMKIGSLPQATFSYAAAIEMYSTAMRVMSGI